MDHLIFFGETLAMLDFQGDETDVSEIRTFLLEQCQNNCSPTTTTTEPNPAYCFLQTVYLLPNMIASVSNLKNPEDISAFFQFVYDTTPFRVCCEKKEDDRPQQKEDLKDLKDLKDRIVVGADDSNHSLILGTIDHDNITYHLYPPIPLPIIDIHCLIGQ